MDAYRKHDKYFNPSRLLNPLFGDTEGQALFEAFLRQHPERFTRGPATGGFAVGPIIAADMSIANLAGSNVEAWELAFEYSHDLFGGRLDLRADATYLAELSIQLSEEMALTDWAGTINGLLSGGFGGTGGLRWKGNSTVAWTNETHSFGWRTRFFDDYFLRQDHSVQPLQGSARISSQIYHDVFATWEVNPEVDLRVGVNNLFDAKPLVDISTAASPIRGFATSTSPSRGASDRKARRRRRSDIAGGTGVLGCRQRDHAQEDPYRESRRQPAARPILIVALSVLTDASRLRATLAAKASGSSSLKIP